MSELLKLPLVLAFFALISIGVTAASAGLASRRPAVSQLTADTRSRLVASYTTDALRKPLQPLDAGVIVAAAKDEADLTKETPTTQPLEPLPTATASATATSGPGTTATARPPGAPTESPSPAATPRPSSTTGPTSTPKPQSSATPGPSSTPAPTSTVTPAVPTATVTPPATFTPTPQPTATLPLPTVTVPLPTATLPLPTSTPPLPTNTPRPTNTPQPTATAAPSPTATPPALGGIIQDLTRLIADLQVLALDQGCPTACTQVGTMVAQAVSKAQTALTKLTGPPNLQSAVSNLNAAKANLQSALGLDPSQDATLQELIQRIDGIVGELQGLM